MEESRVRSRLGAWRAAHPQATFEEIEDEVYRQLAAVHAAWVGELAVPAAADQAGDQAGRETVGEGTPETVPSCVACGEPLRPRGWRRRQVVTRMGATTTLRRRYWVCPACGAGVFPPR